MLKRKIDQAALTFLLNFPHSFCSQSLDQDSRSGESPFSDFQMAVFYLRKADREQESSLGLLL